MKYLRLIISPLIALLIVTPVTVVTVGCPSVASQIQTDGAAIAQMADNIAAQIQAADPTLAAQLETDAATLLQATANFQTGSATTDINSIAGVIEALLANSFISAVCKPCAIVAPLLPILVAGLDVLISDVSGTATVTPAVAARVTSPQAQTNLAALKGYKVPHHFGSSQKMDIVRAWNQTAMTYPGLSAAVIK
jgi:hypothetical protein